MLNGTVTIAVTLSQTVYAHMHKMLSHSIAYYGGSCKIMLVEKLEVKAIDHTVHFCNCQCK